MAGLAVMILLIPLNAAIAMKTRALQVCATPYMLYGTVCLLLIIQTSLGSDTGVFGQ